MKLYNGDCLQILKDIPDKTIDLIVTDPPYLIENTKAGGKTKLAQSIQMMNDELNNGVLTSGFDSQILKELYRVMKIPNIYLWCNHKQIPMYLDFFVKEKGCSFDILIWNKTNATPLFNNKYLTDKEYLLYFRRGGYCQPDSYEAAKTVFFQPINIKDKREYLHPTIKPLNIIKTIIKNSSKEGDVILDCFMGSGTTGVACKELKRNFIGIELEKKWFDIAERRINDFVIQRDLF